MPALVTNSTILDSVMNELRIPVSNLTERTKVQQILTGVYGDICSKFDWWWLQRRAIINTAIKIPGGTAATGTATLFQGSQFVTLTTIPTRIGAAVSTAGSVIVFAGSTIDAQGIYRIEAHTAGLLALTLDAVYTGSTDSAATYTIYQTSYDLPADCAKLTHVRCFGQRLPMQRIGNEDLSYLQQTSRQEGKPQYYSIFDFDTNGDVSTQRQMHVFPFPDQTYRMEVWYKHSQAGDTSTDCDLPIEYQQVLIYGALSRCYPIFLNDLDRGQFFQSLFNDVIALMTKQQIEYASDHPGIATDMRAYRHGSVRSRWPGRSLGNLFDTLPSIP
jgi:hypothetical protein